MDTIGVSNPLAPMASPLVRESVALVDTSEFRTNRRKTHHIEARDPGSDPGGTSHAKSLAVDASLVPRSPCNPRGVRPCRNSGQAESPRGTDGGRP